jgi:hypothetical protein
MVLDVASVGPRDIVNIAVDVQVRGDVDVDWWKASLESTSAEKARKACKS